MSAATGTTGSEKTHSWGNEARDLLRGVGGAAIIGVPLIYTQETYDLASVISTRALTGYLVLALVINVGYNLVSGFRSGGGLSQAMRDSFESLGLGILLGTVLLWLLGIIDGQTPLTDIATKVATEAIPLSLGVSIANTQFGGDRASGESGDETEQTAKPLSPGKATLRDAGITLAGCIILTANIAPTEEVMLLASSLGDIKLFLLVLFSLLLSYGMIFEAGFTGQETRRGSEGILQSPLGETLLAYAIALLVSLAMTIAFHGLILWDSPHTTCACMVVLALPATIGGAAGRLVV